MHLSAYLWARACIHELCTGTVKMCPPTFYICTLLTNATRNLQPHVLSTMYLIKSIPAHPCTLCRMPRANVKCNTIDNYHTAHIMYAHHILCSRLSAAAARPYVCTDTRVSVSVVRQAVAVVVVFLAAVSLSRHIGTQMRTKLQPTQSPPIIHASDERACVRCPSKLTSTLRTRTFMRMLRCWWWFIVRQTSPAYARLYARCTFVSGVIYLRTSTRPAMLPFHLAHVHTAAYVNWISLNLIESYARHSRLVCTHTVHMCAAGGATLE